MRIWRFLTFLALLQVAGCKTMGTGVSETKLIGGELTADSEFPSTFFVRGGCTGTRVSERHILLAAHCVVSKSYQDIKPQFLPEEEWPLGVAAGRVVAKNDDFDDLQLPIVATHVFPEYMRECERQCYKPESLAWLSPNPPDVALIEVEPVPEFAEIPIASIASSEPGEVYVLGYGCETGIDSDEDFFRSDYRLKHQKTQLLNSREVARAPLVGQEKLASFTARYWHTPGKKWREIDQGFTSEEVASLCPGDSGGALYSVRDGQPAVLGVNSFALAANNEDQTGVGALNSHARVDASAGPRMKTWMDEILGGRRTTESQTNESRKYPYRETIEHHLLDDDQPQVEVVYLMLPYGRWAVSSWAQFHSNAEVFVREGDSWKAIQGVQKRPWAAEADGNRLTWHNFDLYVDEPSDVKVVLRGAGGETGPVTSRLTAGGCRNCQLTLKASSIVEQGGVFNMQNAAQKISSALDTGGYKNKLFVEGMEYSRTMDRVWVNVQLLPGGSATSRYDSRANWWVAKSHLQRALRTENITLKAISSFPIE